MMNPPVAETWLEHKALATLRIPTRDDPRKMCGQPCAEANVPPALRGGLAEMRPLQ